MVFILGAANDQSTNEVIELLILSNKPYLRIGTNDRIEVTKIELDSQMFEWDILFTVNSDSVTYNLSDFTAFWYRKGFLNIGYQNNHTPLTKLETEVMQHISTEMNVLADLFISLLEKKKKIGNYTLSTPNKLKVLAAAKKAGIEIPKTLITSSKRELLDFKNAVGEIICKSIGEIFSSTHAKTHYFTRTESVSDELMVTLDDTFPPSLFQENTTKAFEVRSFFFDEKFYSIAIFSQSDEKTKTDFRNYNWRKPNRAVPFKLPVELETKLLALFNTLGLNTGSVDLLYSTDGIYRFLEINPVGQFGFASSSCNYNLESKLANFLTEK